MTVMAERTSQMTVDEFERIAELIGKETDAVRFEFIDGRAVGIELDTEELKSCIR
jgi:hypothetical protein